LVDLSIVIPVYNEADNIRPLLDEIRSALGTGLTYEVVFVDDGSSDDTALRLREYRSTFAPLRVIRHRERCGQSAAIATGVKAARSRWIATLDGDGQNDPADITALLAALRAPDRDPNLQLVAGYRRRREDSWLRRISSRIANRVRAGLLGDDTPDTGCGLKVFARDTFVALPWFDHMHRFLPALVIRNGGSVRSIEVNHRTRARGVSKYGVHNRLWVGIVDLAGVMWLQRRQRLAQIEEED
jgi:dolichol-phosphate mannosyltransferase